MISALWYRKNDVQKGNFDKESFLGRYKEGGKEIPSTRSGPALHEAGAARATDVSDQDGCHHTVSPPNQRRDQFTSVLQPCHHQETVNLTSAYTRNTKTSMVNTSKEAFTALNFYTTPGRLFSGHPLYRRDVTIYSNSYARWGKNTSL